VADRNEEALLLARRIMKRLLTRRLTAQSWGGIDSPVWDGAMGMRTKCRKVVESTAAGATEVALRTSWRVIFIVIGWPSWPGSRLHAWSLEPG